MKEQLNIRKKQLVVTRHKALLAYLLDKDIIKEGEYNWIEHATINDVEGRDVIGVLPLHLAFYAKSVTEVPLKLTPEMRGKELTFDEVEKVAGEPVTYVVRDRDSSDGIDYYMDILKNYSNDEYELAYKYYEHINLDKKYFKSYVEISRARTIYMDIMNCLYSIFDNFNMELQDSDVKDFVFYRNLKCTFEAGLRYKREYAINDRVYYTNVISMEEFNKDEVLKFLNDLIEMCL